MLSYISVKNFAIIENIEVTFNEGMTSVTGETGAGKSLLIDAIGLLLGDRATSGVVRTGSSKAEIIGIFKYDNIKIDKILDELEIDHNDNELMIKRQITSNNNNVIKINNQTVTLKDLRQVTMKLADIHTQLDTHRLINPMTYLDIIDGFEQDKTEELLNLYYNKLSIYKNELKELKRLESSNQDLHQKLDLYRFQKKELESYNLDPNEEETLAQEIESMENFDTIYQTLSKTIQMIESVNAIDVIYDASKELEDIESFNDEYKVLKDRMQSTYFELDDAFSVLKGKMTSLDFNPQLLEEYQSRMNSLDNLKKKYRKDIPELIDYLDEITKDINNIDNYDDVIKDQMKTVEESFTNALEVGKEISDLRRMTSSFIEQELLKILADLELPNTRFTITYNEYEEDYMNSSLFLENGIDEVDFMLSTNIGEPLKPLSRSASGGEMSRIMLGFKNLLAKSLGLSLIIFDEIDTGVSGFVANQVAKKMMEISKGTQVICITHIPQVASISHHHLYIQKTVEDNRTKSHISALSGESRVKEIASMISGDHVSDASMESARELLSK